MIYHYGLNRSIKASFFEGPDFVSLEEFFNDLSSPQWENSFQCTFSRESIKSKSTSIQELLEILSKKERSSLNIKLREKYNTANITIIVKKCVSHQATREFFDILLEVFSKKNMKLEYKIHFALNGNNS